jgi:predicted MPP superfamily phosphohydrolase
VQAGPEQNLNSPIRILHFSDLHLEKESLRDQKVVLKSLFADIRGSIKKDGPFDLVFFTGDLIAKGGYDDASIEMAIDEFILPVLDAAEIQPSQLILVPGNHDVNLRQQSQLLAGAQRSLSSDEEVARYLTEAISSSINTGLEGFNSLVDRLGCQDFSVLSNNHYRAYVLNIKGLNVGIAAFNSAWHATGASADGDYGRLRIGRKQTDELVEALGNADVKFALAHHPTDWLTPKEAQAIRRQLLIHFDGFFHGHNHDPDMTFSVGASSHYFASNAGCLYQNRDYFNGYCIIEYRHRERRWTIAGREYVEARQSFDLAPRVGPGGLAEFLRMGDRGGSQVAVLPSEEYIEAVQKAGNSRLLPALVSDVAPKNLKSIFVDPLLSRISARKIETSKNGESGLFTSLKDVLSLRKDVIFVGAKDIGKSTLAHRICQQLLENGGVDGPAFSAYVNLEGSIETVASIVDSIVSFSGGAYRKSEVVQLLKDGSFTVCFDNVQEQREKQTRAVREFCGQYSTCRFFFTMLEDVDYSLSPEQVPRLSPVCEVFYMHPFGRKETRLLTEKWFGEATEEVSTKVDEVLSLLNRLNIPRSPFLISALLWIREKQTQFSPVNQAEILDALIDGVMEKLSETKDRSRIDSTIKRHFLAALAEHLHTTGLKRIDALALERFTVDYFQSKGLPSSTAPFLSDLKAKGILLDVGGDVIFMFEAVRAFFLSTRLHENPGLLKKALSKDHFLDFREELDYYTGRHRDQAEVLQAAVEVLRSFSIDAALKHDLKEFDRIRMAPTPISIKETELRKVTAERPSAESRNAIIESFDEQLGSDIFYTDERVAHSQTAVGKYLSALGIASSILRNSELVGNVELKEIAYNEFTQGWCTFLIEVLSSLSRESTSPTVKWVDRDDPVAKLLKRMLPNDNPGMAGYMRKLVVPNVIVSLAMESLGTAKLQTIIERHISVGKTTVQRVLDVFLIVDLRLPNWTGRMDRLLRDNSKNRFVSELIFTKLFQIFMLGRLRPSEEEKVKGMLAESITLMLSEKRGGYKTHMKGRFLNSLEKKRLGR